MSVTLPSRTARLGYRPELDGLRALAVFAVMILHSYRFLPGFDFRGGFLGVDVFFVLSGYLITTLLIREEQATNNIRLRAFYVRRALRLLPALFVALVLGAVVVAILGDNPGPRSYPQAALLTLSYLANWFQARAPFGVLSHTWTLAIEEQYYLIWPTVLVLLTRYVKSKRLMATGLLGVAALVGVFRYVVFASGRQELAALSTLTRADGVIIGSALALALAASMPRLERIFEMRATAVVAASAMLGISLVMYWNSPWLFRGVLFLMNIATAVLVGHLAVKPGSLAVRLLSIQPLPALGRISYGIYLYHVPINYLIHGKRFHMTGTSSVVWMFAASIAFATVSYLAIEQPALRLKRRFGGITMTSVPASATPT